MQSSKFFLNNFAQSCKNTFICSKFRTNPILKVNFKSYFHKFIDFLEATFIFLPKINYLSLIQQTADSLTKIDLVGTLPPSGASDEVYHTQGALTLHNHKWCLFGSLKISWSVIGRVNCSVRVISRQNSSDRVLLKGFSGFVTDLAFSHPTSSTLAAVDDMGNLMVWNLEQVAGNTM